uniref:Uncharacterized protein n=1 Tax=Trichogramma kaykai TaxID=54128 RepID=A0ABD2XH15_9HYME
MVVVEHGLAQKMSDIICIIYANAFRDKDGCGIQIRNYIYPGALYSAYTYTRYVCSSSSSAGRNVFDVRLCRESHTTQQCVMYSSSVGMPTSDISDLSVLYTECLAVCASTTATRLEQLYALAIEPQLVLLFYAQAAQRRRRRHSIAFEKRNKSSWRISGARIELCESTMEFVHNTKKIEAIDVVPTEWITFNKVKKLYSAQFLPPPYDEDTCALLQTFVKQKMDAPEDWPRYTVKLKDTYEEAVNKLKDLQTEALAFTADSDDNDNDFRKQLENQIKRAKLLSAQATVIERLKANDNFQNDGIMDTSQEETAYSKKSDDSSFTIDVFAPSCSKMITESTEKRNDYVPMESIVLPTAGAEDSNAIILASIEFEIVFYKEIMSKLNEIQGEIKVLNNKQDEIKRFMAGKEVVSTLQGKINLKKV